MNRVAIIAYERLNRIHILEKRSQAKENSVRLRGESVIDKSGSVDKFESTLWRPSDSDNRARVLLDRGRGRSSVDVELDLGFIPTARG